MRRVAEILQAAGAAVFTGAGFTINVTVGLYGAAVALIVTGVVVERS